MVVYELSLHYLYFSSISWYAEAIVSKFTYWEISGLGYWLGQAFHIKYLVLYGIPGTLSRIDGIDAPHVPRCLAWITLYSQVWKWFDKGLYDFLKM